MSARGGRHDAGHPAEYFADATGNIWHNRSGGNGYETGHQGVLDQVLGVIVLPNPQAPNRVQVRLHRACSPQRLSIRIEPPFVLP